MASAIPYDLADTDKEVVEIWYTYGQAAVRSGIRYPKQNQPPVMGEVTVPACRKADTNDVEWRMKCAPFRMDYWTAPLWFEIRDVDNSDMPPR